MEELVLGPGEYFFGHGNVRVRTLLGSCVAITLWHPVLRIGGICHYLLPCRKRRHEGKPDGRYADEALEFLLQHIDASGKSLKEYALGVFGGGDMFPDGAPVIGSKVGAKNIDAALHFARQHGLRPLRSEVGGKGYRNLSFNLHSGQIEASFIALPGQSEQCVICCNGQKCFGSACSLRCKTKRGGAQ